MPGIDRRYLEAEALWRSGRLAQALASLAAGMADVPGSSKCRRLFTALNGITRIDAAAAAALEDGEVFPKQLVRCAPMLQHEALLI